MSSFEVKFVSNSAIRSARIMTVLSVIVCGCYFEEGMEQDQDGFLSDEEVMSKAYDFNYTVPDEFFIDERSDTSGSYTIYHVKDESISYELCTDDVAEAMEWESADNDSRAVGGVFVELYENDRYYEIVRDLDYSGSIGNISEPTSPGFSRIFKCEYADRTGVDRNIRNGFAGHLNDRPLDPDLIRIYVEYLWQFTFFWPQQKTVLASISDQTPEAFKHILRLAFITNRGYENCDLVEVVDWTFSVDRNSGEVTKTFEVLYSFDAELVNGRPQKC